MSHLLLTAKYYGGNALGVEGTVSQQNSLTPPHVCLSVCLMPSLPDMKFTNTPKILLESSKVRMIISCCSVSQDITTFFPC